MHVMISFDFCKNVQTAHIKLWHPRPIA